MNNFIPKLSSGLFILIIVCFFMPFVVVSCSSQPIATFTGVELATGKTVAPANSFNIQNQEQKTPGEPLASLALGAACAGAAISFVSNNRTKYLAWSVIGGIGTLLMLAIKMKVDRAAYEQGQGILLVEYAGAFWVTFLSFISAAIANIYALFKKPEL